MLAACNDEEEFTCRLQSFEISAVTTTTATLTAVIDASDMEAVDQMGFCVRRTSDVDFEWIAIPKSRTIICRLDDLAEGATYECRAFVRAVGESWTFPVERFTTQKGGGSDPDPDPNPDPDPDPTPDPDPDPNPDPDPDPTPDPDGPVYRTGWVALPGENDADGDGRDDKNPTYYYAHHLCAGNESNAQDNGSARNFSVCYSSEHHCPVWVAAPRHKCYSGSANRTNAYGQDPQIPSDIQYYSKSTGGGCNKGHMVGSAERTSSSATNRQVFYYTNIAPQNMSTFNTGGGAWNNLEDHIDGLVCADTLYEVVGCYFDSYTDAYGSTSSPRRIEFGGRSDVSKPTMFYYALLRTKRGNTKKSVSECSADELQCVAFVISHTMEKGHKPQAKDMISVEALERLTGFTYFPNVPNAPKKTFTPSDWL